MPGSFSPGIIPYFASENRSMKKIQFVSDILPHIVAVLSFLIITTFFFKPVFLDNKVLQQNDIQEWEGMSKAVRDFRDATGEEPLWAPGAFAGIPAVLINVEWSNQPVIFLKKILGLFISHPYNNIYLAFLSYYILLLSFGVRPYLAISGAIAFGLSSFIIIGLVAGHNSRIGATALAPLVVAGVHLAFTKRLWLGFGVTTAAVALQLRENHLQVTYYLFLLLVIYGIVQLIYYIRQKDIASYFKIAGLEIIAAVIGLASFVGPLWSISEYTPYSTRGKNVLTPADTQTGGEKEGLDIDYAFYYSSGIFEPLTLLIPNIFGGSSSDYLVANQESKTYEALVRSDQQLANQLAPYTSAYWGSQPFTSPYYAGAVVVFLFAIGIAFVEARYKWWLIAGVVLGIMLTWGKNFESFNYFLFNHLPGYNKFRSVTFALGMALFCMPLLGWIGLEHLMRTGIDKDSKRKILISVAITAGLCLFLIVFTGVLSFTRTGENQLPDWLLRAMVRDRKALLQGDAIRSIIFIVPVFLLLYFGWIKKIPQAGVFAGLALWVLIDIASVTRRYLSETQFIRKREKAVLTATAANQEILKDKGYYRVYNLQSFGEAMTSYHHNSLGGYHGAPLRRYRDLYDSCLSRETDALINDARAGELNFASYGALNMLNAKYLVYGPDRTNIIVNPAANGHAWFVRNLVKVATPAEALARVCEINTKTTAVVDASVDAQTLPVADSAASITLEEFKPNFLRYQANAAKAGLAVFSEIYYPEGWSASIDGKPAEILLVNYTLRGLVIPAGAHEVTFSFRPDSYVIGNSITAAGSWLMIFVLLGSIAISWRKHYAAG